MSKRLEKIAKLIYQTTREREIIADLKDTQSRLLWEAPPPKHQPIYDEYEPLIRKHAHLLADLDARLEKLRPKTRKLQGQVNELVEYEKTRGKS